MTGWAGKAFVILIVAGVPLAAVYRWAAGNTVTSSAPGIFAIGGVLAFLLAALSRAGWRLSGAPGTGPEPNPLPWVVLAGVLWLAAGSMSAAPGASPVMAFLVLWAAVAGSAVAVAEAYAVQQARVHHGHSRLPPSSIVAGGIVLFLVQPLLTPIIALGIALIRRAELTGR